MFVLIGFGVPWTGWFILRGTAPPSRWPDTFGTYWFTGACSFAGFAAALAEGGIGGFRSFATRVFNLRFSVWLWIAALLLPAAAALLTFANHPADLLRGDNPKFAALLGTVSFANFFTGPIAEEFGWRGYLLNQFCRHWRPAAAGLLIAPIWVVWHIPLFYDSVFAHLRSVVIFVTWVAAWSVVLALLVARARGSVLPAVLGHWAINAQPPIFFALLPALAGEKQPGGIAFSVTSIAVAIAVALLWRRTKWQPADEEGQGLRG